MKVDFFIFDEDGKQIATTKEGNDMFWEVFICL